MQSFAMQRGQINQTSARPNSASIVCMMSLILVAATSLLLVECDHAKKPLAMTRGFF